MIDYGVKYTDFSTGLDTTTAVEDSPSTSVKACKNADFSFRGSIKTRNRYKLLKNLPNAVDDIFYYYAKNTGAFCAMVQCGNMLIKVDDTNASQIDTVTDINSAVTFWVPGVGKDCFIYNDGVNLKKYDGSAVSSLGASVNGKHLAVHKNRLCVAGNTASGTEEVVYLSKIGTPNDFSEGIAIRIPTWQGDEILRIMEYMDKLYVFMHNSVHAIVGNVVEDFSTYPIINNMGLLTMNCLGTNGADMILIAGDKKAYVFNGKDLQDISSETVRPYFDNIDISKRDKVRVFVISARCFFILPQLDGTTATLTYDMSRQQWKVDDLGSVTAIGSFRRNEINFPVVGIGAALFEETNEQGVDDFSGVNVPFMVNKPIGAESTERIKKFKKLFLGVKSTMPVTVSWHTDAQPDPKTYTFTPSKEEEVIRLTASGRVMDLTITGSKDVEIGRITVTGLAKDPK